uniref:NADH-ubiquinone oxidoreductase chain 3 n=1 Tax=Cheumatopsyche speciosa TaxID=763295 RepID=A0A3G1NDC9_9NEOP|nr:NADH dehydrogenase subunit 3 [Cheumatopsyche speciosa]AUT18166.1 NADH dehydrogenase subunit 3 [Cheumatopsyche speciosa]
MFSIMSISLISLIIPSIMTLLSILISKKKNFNREKFSPFECGFDPKSQPRMPFSIQFFMITIIFLIFDVEISIIFPLILTYEINSKLYWYLTTIFFMIILILGIFYEWFMNYLNWKF